jgi:hypothetical protein
MMMTRSKVMQRESSMHSSSKGMLIVMSDGWRGKVEQTAGGIVVCIGDGQRPNDHWCGDYRLVAPGSIRIEGSKAVVAWKSAARSDGTRVCCHVRCQESSLTDPLQAEIRITY